MPCAIKPPKLNQSKKKTANQNDKFEKESRKIQSFFKQHKTFPYDKNENRNRNHFQNENKKNNHKGDQEKKHRAQKRSTGSPIMNSNMMKGERQQSVSKKEIKCYNCQKLKHYANDCPEPDHKQQKNIRKQ